MSETAELDAIGLTWDKTYDEFLNEALMLIVNHWHEVGSHRDVLRLNPDHNRYRQLELGGFLHILCATDRQKIVGYMFVMLLPHPRDKNAIIGRDDVFYVTPEYRRRGVGLLLLKEALRFLEEDTCDIVMFSEKVRRTAARGARGGTYLRRFGFAPQEVVWSKVMPRAARRGEQP